LSFAHSEILWLLLILPPGMVAFFWWSWRSRRQFMTQFIHPRLLPGLIAGLSATRQKVLAGGLVLGVAGLIVALAQPQWGYDLQEIRQRGLDIVVAIDTSKSMLAEDIAPNRLERAKLAALDLMQQAKSDRLGLVAFAGTAFLQCPLTFDDVAFRQSLQSLNVRTIPEGGTALAAAIEQAAKAFKEGDSHKTLVLFTDGEDHDSGALAAAKKAADAGMRIFTIGIGSTEGDLVRIKEDNGQSDYVRDENGNVVKSHLNASLLQQIAGESGGFYLHLSGANTVDTLYQKGLAPLPKSESREKWIHRARERYHWPLAFGLVLLVVEMLVPERKKDKRIRQFPSDDTGLPAAPGRSPKQSRAPALSGGLALILIALWPTPAGASPSSALREYKSGHYPQALSEFERALEKKKDDPRLQFNAGAAAYRNHQLDLAAKHFDQVIGSPDIKLQEESYYNLGNVLYRLGEQAADPAARSARWEDALKNFENSLKLNSQDPDARFNYEFVKKKLEELKKQQQQQQQNQKQQDKQQQDKQQQKDQKKPDQGQQQQEKQDQKDQKQDGSKDNQQQNSQSQQQQEKKQNPSQDQKQDQDKSSQQQPERKEQGQEDQEQARAPGEMTPREARQLLDSHKNDEMTLPVSRKEKPTDQDRQVKDW
jgi:Ca-activated chloride channel family protein